MKKLLYLCGPLISILAFSACSKNNDHHGGGDTDTLSQSIYAINPGGTSAAAEILCAPFLSTSKATTGAPGLLLVMDQNGKVLKKKETDEQAFCFRKWSVNGQTRYSYVMNDVNAYRPAGTGNYAGPAIITDSNLKELWRANFIPSGPAIFETTQALDVHDLLVLGDGHYIAMAYVAKPVTNIPTYLNPAAGIEVFAPVIQEVNNGAVVWQWDGSSDTSFYANSVEGNNFSDLSEPQDYMHMNAMFIDPSDNGLVCSFRTQDQLVKIDRTTGKIKWRLGGKNSDFKLFSDQIFLRQHDPSLVDDGKTLLLFDNGDANLRPESRILEFRLDEANKTVTSFKSFTIPEPFAQFMGSVQKNGDVYFIGGGTANYMLEVNSVTGVKLKEFLGGEYSTYRAYSYPVHSN